VVNALLKAVLQVLTVCSGH